MFMEIDGIDGNYEYYHNLMSRNHLFLFKLITILLSF